MDKTELVDYGVDWMTLTAKRLMAWNGSEGKDYRDTLITEYYGGQAGMVVQPWSWNGYSGTRLGALSMGSRHDGSIIRVSGGAARVMCDAIGYEEFVATRLDLQATIRINTETVSEYIEKQAGLVEKAMGGKNGRPTKMSLTKGYGDGDTFTCGSRASEMFWRIYDKGAQSEQDEGYAGCVRIELELKGQVAKRTWAAIRSDGEPNRKALELLCATALDRGFSALVGKLDTDCKPIKTRPQVTDMDRQLAWLETSVSGAVRRLMYDGREADVIHALGLREYMLTGTKTQE